MYSAVIIEDEQLTREELVLTTPWKELGIELVGTAEDGLSGEQLILEKKPDIVITDIRLPGQDGLTMLKKCGVVQAIIISGYSDFSYMKEALHLEAYDYLLKPSAEGELEKTLASLVEKLNIQTNRQKQMSTVQQLAIALPTLSGNFMAHKALELIEVHYAELFGLNEASDMLNISESHLSRVFKEASGWNFLQYLNAYRINKSIELLSEPQKNITDIALACGFASAGYYTKLYRRFMGETPSQTRERIKDSLN